jgi:hypothetical protein
MKCALANAEDEIPISMKCRCGTITSFSASVYAKWHTKITCTCTVCHAQITLLQGKIIEFRPFSAEENHAEEVKLSRFDEAIKEITSLPRHDPFSSGNYGDGIHVSAKGRELVGKGRGYGSTGEVSRMKTWEV